MGLSRRFLNLIVDNPNTGGKSLRCFDLNLRRHNLFDTTTPVPKRNALGSTKIRLPSPSFNMRASDFDLKDQRMHFFQAADQRVFCLDQLGRGLLLEADTSRLVMMPCLHKPKSEPVSLYIPCSEPDFEDLDGGGGGDLFIMDRKITNAEPDGGGCQFEALVYRRPSFSGALSKSWYCELLPLPPCVRDTSDSCLEISSCALVKAGSQVCISVDGEGTYCLDAASNSNGLYGTSYTWSEVGRWMLPFQGKVHYAPDLKLWFGFTVGNQDFAAANLSTMDSQPELLKSWKELEPPKGWQQVQDPQLVSLGSRRFCIARFFRIVSTKCGFEDESSYQNVTVLTGVEVSRAYGFADQVLLEMVKHRSLSHRSGCGEDTITAVF